MMQCNIEITPSMAALNEAFANRGFELWFVGGCVRDSMQNIVPKDIDFATSATPDEQIAIYDAAGFHYIATGLQHGTVTVVIDHEPYEVTTFRIDAETDGRHASVEYTRDIMEDMARRDLTINAIAMDFSGNIFDPFDGVSDIEKGVIRFVGDARERITEDYLRILRFFRFYGRFGRAAPDADTLAAITETCTGLNRISVERIWAEVSKIVTGPRAGVVIDLMRATGVWEQIGMVSRDNGGLEAARRADAPAPFIMAAMGETQVSTRWKWANAEQAIAAFFTKRANTPYDEATAKRDIVDGVDPRYVQWIMAYQGNDATASKVASWPVPTFPVTGQDMIDAGVEPGPEMGRKLKSMRAEWINSDYTVDKYTLMRMFEM